MFLHSSDWKEKLLSLYEGPEMGKQKGEPETCPLSTLLGFQCTEGCWESNKIFNYEFKSVPQRINVENRNETKIGGKPTMFLWSGKKVVFKSGHEALRINLGVLSRQAKCLPLRCCNKERLGGSRNSLGQVPWNTEGRRGLGNEMRKVGRSRGGKSWILFQVQ